MHINNTLSFNRYAACDTRESPFINDLKIVCGILFFLYVDCWIKSSLKNKEKLKGLFSRVVCTGMDMPRLLILVAKERFLSLKESPSPSVPDRHKRPIQPESSYAIRVGGRRGVRIAMKSHL